MLKNKKFIIKFWSVYNLKINDQMRIQNSQLLSDQSELSILAIPVKNELQRKCQDLLKQSSQYRCLIRQLKQDNEWIKISNQGLQNECSTLKDLLREKKDMIAQCNSDLRMANQQINRLQDCIDDKNQQINNQQIIINQKNQRMQQKDAIIKELQFQIEKANKNIQILQKQLEHKSFEDRQKQTEHLYIFEERIRKVLDRCSSKQEKISNNYETLLNELINKIQSLTQKQLQFKMQINEKSSQKKIEDQNNRKIIQILEMQLKQASDVAGQFQIENAKNCKRIKQLQLKLQSATKQNSKQIQQTFTQFRFSVTKLIQLICPLLEGEVQLEYKLKELMKPSKSQYELDLILQQIRPIIIKHSQSQQETRKQKKDLKDWESKLLILQEEYDSLKLKHTTLQREFQAVVDDNKRILKFNQLSRYRTERNIRSIGKQNNKNFTNFKQLNTKR